MTTQILPAPCTTAFMETEMAYSGSAPNGRTASDGTHA
jgi:hypothetical protein